MPDTFLPWFAPLLAAPFVGSFLGVLIRRLPAGRPVVLGRSACDACGRTLSAADLVPLVSYLALGGRCRTCRAPIGPALPAIELAALGIALTHRGEHAGQPIQMCGVPVHSAESYL
ncbi:MAG: prepilin peptidase, partial [Proteobacteria bacterium]|nr:prepilin peptidase [Pseudomonadota bacterium]